MNSRTNMGSNPWLRSLYNAGIALLTTAAAIVLIGFGQRVGWIATTEVSSTATSGESSTKYICPMMCTPPSTEAGRCPVCAMELVPASSDEEDSDGRSVSVATADRRLLGIETIVATAQPVARSVRSVGTLEVDESRLARIVADAGGRVEKLLINYTGQTVAAGEPVAELYSPELYNAQRELLTLKNSRKQRQPSQAVLRYGATDFDNELLAAGRDRLIELGMTQAQVDGLEESGKAATRTILQSPQTGTVTRLMLRQGDYVKPGQVVCEVADLSNVWLLTEFYPQDAATIRYAQEVTATVRSLPTRTFVGRVSFVDPMVDPTTQTVKVRIELANPSGLLRPGDEATVEASVAATPDAVVYDVELAGKWISPRHPDVIKDEPGLCPRSNRPLVAAAKYGYSSSPEETTQVVVVPRNAVLQAGLGSVAYVESEPGRFEIRQVSLGSSFGDRVAIVDGIKAGEKVATSGNFLIDSQMQLSGNPSLIDIARLEPAKAVDPFADPEVIAALADLSPDDVKLVKAQRVCPVTDMLLGSMGEPPKLVVDDRTIFLCCDGCRGMLMDDLPKYLAKLDEGPADIPDDEEEFEVEVPAISEIMEIEE